MYDEEAYIKTITVPLVKGRRLDTLITLEIKMKFEDVNNLLYSYVINKKYKDKMDVTIYCINNKNNKIFKDIISNNNKITSITLYQFNELQNILRYSTNEECIISMYNNNSLYYVYASNGIPMANTTVLNAEDWEKCVVDNLNVFIKYYLEGVSKNSFNN